MPRHGPATEHRFGLSRPPRRSPPPTTSVTSRSSCSPPSKRTNSSSTPSGAGASGYLGKAVEPEVLLDAIRSVAAGDSLLSPTATRALISRVLSQPNLAPARTPTALADLTPREREILTLVASGLSNDHIADRLIISPATAKTHINRTMTKLNARDRAQLVIIAYETGLITPGRKPD